MNIPDKAVEAAARAEYLSPTPGLEFAVEPDWESLAEHEKQHWRDDVRASLEAAAPFIAAQALKDHATAVVTHKVNAAPAFFEGMKFSALLAMDYASHIEEEQ